MTRLKDGGLQVKHLNAHSTNQSHWVLSYGFGITVGYLYSFAIPICHIICYSEFNVNPKRVSLIVISDGILRDMPDHKIFQTLKL